MAIQFNIFRNQLLSDGISMCYRHYLHESTVDLARCETRAPEMLHKGQRKFRLRNHLFRLELDNFACERILFRQAPRKLLKSLRREMYDFAL